MSQIVNACDFGIADFLAHLLDRGQGASQQARFKTTVPDEGGDFGDMLFANAIRVVLAVAEIPAGIDHEEEGAPFAARRARSAHEMAEMVGERELLGSRLEACGAFRTVRAFVFTALAFRTPEIALLQRLPGDFPHKWTAFGNVQLRMAAGLENRSEALPGKNQTGQLVRSVREFRESVVLRFLFALRRQVIQFIDLSA